MKILHLAFLGTCLFAVAACEQKEQQIIGKWQTTGTAPLVYQFEERGRMTIGSNNGTYSFGDSGKLKLRTPSATYLYHLRFAENGNRMIWTDPAGKEQLLERIAP